MKKTLTLMLSVLSLCMLAGCANVNITITKKDDLLRDLEKNNRYDDIFDKYGYFRVDVSGTRADGTENEYSVYYGDTYIEARKQHIIIDDHGDLYGYDYVQGIPFHIL